MEEKQYVTTPILWTKEFENEISEVYRLFKDQENKIFDLAWHDENPNGLMDFIENIIRQELVFVVKDGDRVAGAFILVNPNIFRNVVLSIEAHCAISKRYWGKTSRDVMNSFKEYLRKNFNINRIIATVPQCGYGVIKLLKNIGFRHEGTIKRVLVYNDKNNQPKLYDKLIYALDMEEK